ncbi:hypothetical protein J4436_00845 [Candidatus Woesearchaeota archaeon]|nr:hypothetical protein [Candidatus Woesearchaeota archaeon]
MKTLGVFAALMLLVSMLPVFTEEVSALPFQVTQIQVNDMLIDKADFWGYSLNVERGSDLEITVYLVADENAEDVTVEVELIGYEYDSLEDRTSQFDIEAGVAYSKDLIIEIPEDFEASDYHELEITVRDDNGNSEFLSFDVRVQEQTHMLNIYDVLMSPSKVVEAGEPLFVSVRIENLGDELEEDIKVTASILELDIEDSTYIDELVPDFCDNEDDYCKDEYDDEDAQSTEDLVLFIPADAKSDTYNVVVSLEYNRGHELVEDKESYMIEITGIASEEETENNALVTVDSSKRDIEVGTGVVYTLTIANLGEEEKTYAVVVDGVGSWGDSRVDPSFVTVSPGETAESFIYITADEEASEGTKSFTVKVKDGENIVAQSTLESNVGGVATSDDFVVKKALEIGFIVLIALLVLLVIIVIIKKIVQSKNNDEEEVEGQSYY